MAPRCKLSGCPASGEVVAVGGHHLGPGGDEVVDELLRAVVLGIDLGIGTQDRVRAEHQVDAGRGVFRLKPLSDCLAVNPANRPTLEELETYLWQSLILTDPSTTLADFYLGALR